MKKSSSQLFDTASVATTSMLVPSLLCIVEESIVATVVTIQHNRLWDRRKQHILVRHICNARLYHYVFLHRPQIGFLYQIFRDLSPLERRLNTIF